MGTRQVHRLIRLITLLQSGRIKSAEELTSQLSISRRTLFRDLKLLEASGVPYYFERGKGYRIQASFFLPPINLTVAETIGLMVLGKTAEANADRPLASSAISALHKLTATIPDSMRTACDQLLDSTSINSERPTDGRDESRVFYDLQRGIDQGRVCDIVYRSPADNEDLRCRHYPFAMHLANNAWYVLGKTSAHGQEVRIFKLVRFRSVTLTEETFRRPKNFKVSDKLGNAWRLIPEGKEYDITIEFRPMVATNVSEVRWHPTQTTQMLDDGSCRLNFRIDGIKEIAWWICGYADQARVIKPAALRRRVYELQMRSAEVNRS
ncbi:MAG: WYL domain-containing protein [Planctomycetota bacterium]